METLADFLARHRRMFPQDDLRLGQRFCNEFISAPMGQLYYETDDERALEMILAFLGDLQYLPHTPPEKGFR